jgi:hypothetical protein
MFLKFSVFGKTMFIERKDDKWLLFTDSGTGKKMREYDVVIPYDLGENDLAGYLADIYHEYANEKFSSVVRLD